MQSMRATWGDLGRSLNPTIWAIHGTRHARGEPHVTACIMQDMATCAQSEHFEPYMAGCQTWHAPSPNLHTVDAQQCRSTTAFAQAAEF